MDLYQLVASWTGWPFVVAVLILVGGAALWLLKSRLEYQKEINEKLQKDLETFRTGTSESFLVVNTVTYRAVIKLIHDRTGLALHSHNRNYEHPDSSRQQQVTAFAGSNEDDYWTIKAAHNYKERYKSAEAIHHGDIVRLEHLTTRKNLHSHSDRRSPVSGQQEVTAYGGDGIGDTNDNWKVDLEGSEIWLESARVRLIHQATGAALHSHSGHNLPDYGFNQQEVTCFRDRNQDDWWRAVIYKDVQI